MSRTKTLLREELPRPLPWRMKKLHVDERGYPVPYFVAWLNDENEPVGRSEGHPDFRMIFPGAIIKCHRESRCWICGAKMDRQNHRSFVIGPMCAINRNNAEPPSHFDCADWSARACPFLTRPHMTRNEKSGKEHAVPPPGVAIMRNPGVACVWTCRSYTTHRDPAGGLLFKLGDPTSVRWHCEGRPATRAEVQHSIDTGLPFLKEYCHGEDDLELLRLELEALDPWLPKN